MQGEIFTVFHSVRTYILILFSAVFTFESAQAAGFVCKRSVSEAGAQTKVDEVFRIADEGSVMVLSYSRHLEGSSPAASSETKVISNRLACNQSLTDPVMVDCTDGKQVSLKTRRITEQRVVAAQGKLQIVSDEKIELTLESNGAFFPANPTDVVVYRFSFLPKECTN